MLRLGVKGDGNGPPGFTRPEWQNLTTRNGSTTPRRRLTGPRPLLSKESADVSACAVGTIPKAGAHQSELKAELGRACEQ
jgi:hypothetical protein